MPIWYHTNLTTDDEAACARGQKFQLEDLRLDEEIADKQRRISKKIKMDRVAKELKLDQPSSTEEEDQEEAEKEHQNQKYRVG